MVTEAIDETLYSHPPSRACRLSRTLQVRVGLLLFARVVKLSRDRGLSVSCTARALIALGLEAVGRGCVLTRADASPLISSEPGDIGSYVT